MRIRSLALASMLTFSITHVVISQATVYDMVDPRNQNTSLMYGKLSDTKNKHYLMEYFNNGTVNLNSGAKLVNIRLNYDPFTDAVITKSGEKDFIIDRNTVVDFSMFDVKSSATYTFVKVTEGTNTFFGEQLLVCQDFSIYKRNAKHLRTSSPDVGYGSDNFKNNNTFTDQSEYYIKTKDQVMLIHKKNEQLLHFLQTLDDKHSQKLTKLKTNVSNQQAIISYFRLFCK